jgi:hypothetical protein
MRLFHLMFVAVSLLFLFTCLSYAQKLPTTGESALDRDSTQSSSTFVGGYGNALYQHDANQETARLNLERFVLFVGHRFSERISFFSELEVEDAKVEGGEPGGEIALEQAYLKFDLNRNLYLVAGLFIPRIGIINEDHLPNRFNGNERPLVETYVIPSTWRELGVGLYGTIGRIPLHYSVAVVNGLNSAAFEHGTGIRGGRFEGRDASANNLAVTAALQYQPGSLQLQVSGYAGGTVGLSRASADTLHLASGAFGTPVILGEAHARFERGGLQAKVLGTIVSIPEAESINDAFANNTPQRMYGAFAEVGYDILSGIRTEPRDPELIVFLRLERFDLNATMPSNGVKDEELDQTHLIGGLTYLPHPNVVIKGDVRLARYGNQASTAPPGTEATSIETRNTFLNLGFGFSF